MASTDNHEFDFAALAALSDDEIDTSDISSRAKLTHPVVGKYSDIEYRGYDVRSIANWCIRKAREAGVSVSKLWINKIVALVYERSLVSAKILLTPARMEAWEFGPVFREIYLQFPSDADGYYHRYNVRTRSREVAMDPFSRDDLEVFEETWRKYGHLSGSALTTITHRVGTPWRSVWDRGGAVNPGMLIDIETILGRNGDRTHGKDR